MLVYIIIAIVVLLVIYTLFIYNGFIKLNNKLNEAFSTMDVYLKKRWDLIPNIVEVVKGYAKHENNTLKEIVELRNNSYESMNNTDKLNTNEKLSQGISRIMALVESYPDLKANENFKDLSKQLVLFEDEIAQSRKYYNAVVKEFNNKVEMFPSNIFAKLFGYNKKKMFLANDNERENVNISL